MKKTTLTVLGALALFAGSAVAAEAPQKPIPLDWKSIRLAPLDYNRTAIDGGAALYTIPGKGEKKFRIDLLFLTGIYHFPQGELAAAEATADLFMKGGAGSRNYEEIDNYAVENGLKLSVSHDALGKLLVQIEGLTEDFEKALALVEDVVLRPRFDEAGFTLWKQERIDSFRSVLDAGNQRKQNRFMSYALNRVALGENHPYTQTLARQSPKTVEALKLPRIREMAKAMVNRVGLNAVLTGGYTPKNQEALAKFLLKIPRGEIRPETWLPARPLPAPGKTRVVVLRKEDMKTSRIEVRSYVLGAGRLNKIEKAETRMAEEVFSSSGGVVGNDRWSKAMRGDTGFGYAPQAGFVETTLKPNVGVGMWYLAFQSPNERVHEAYRAYRKTWDEYATKGVTPEELEWARVSRMNIRLSREDTLFDKADGFLDDLSDAMLPSPTPIEGTLARFELTKDPVSINGTLNRIAAKDLTSVMVIMGNPTTEALAELKKQPDVELTETLELSKVVAGLVQ